MHPREEKQPYLGVAVLVQQNVLQLQIPVADLVLPGVNTMSDSRPNQTGPDTTRRINMGPETASDSIARRYVMVSYVNTRSDIFPRAAISHYWH